MGFADYVLYDDSHRPLAVIEAKRTCTDVAKGRDFVKLNDLTKEKETTQVLLDEKMDRWVYLQDLAERIEQQKS